MKHLKFICTLFLFTILLLGTNNESHAQAIVTETQISEDLICVTTITELPSTSCLQSISPYATTKTKTGKKTSAYKNKSGTTLWSVTVTATFSYNGSTSSCTAASGSASSSNANWKVSNIASSKSGNTGTASAKGSNYYKGTFIQSISKSASLSCSKSGTLS